MRKILFLLLIFSQFSFSEIGTFLYGKNTRCVKNLIANPNDKGFCYVYSNHPDTQYCTKNAKLSNFIRGYQYINNECVLEDDLKLTGMTKSEYNTFVIFLSLIFVFIFFYILFMLVI